MERGVRLVEESNHPSHFNVSFPDFITWILFKLISVEQSVAHGKTGTLQMEIFSVYRKLESKSGVGYTHVGKN